ncbi:MAG: hypothetical protein V9G23_10755 [Giesbergeria sp.]
MIATITPFILLHAFANGTTALTGVEAISNGITAFKEPRSKNAGVTLIWMSLILGTLFLGPVLSHRVRCRRFFPRRKLSFRNWHAPFTVAAVLAYLLLISGTTVILIMAANTAFADFPRLGALHRRGRIPSAPAYLSWKPIGLFAWDRDIGCHRLAPDHYSSRPA